jgi:hypothetical protein
MRRREFIAALGGAAVWPLNWSTRLLSTRLERWKVVLMCPAPPA